MWRVYIKDDKGALMRLPKKFFGHEGGLQASAVRRQTSASHRC
jgi:hypothetical protein